MRAVAILGPKAKPNDVVSFQRTGLNVAVSQAQSPQADVDAVLIFGGDGTVHRHLPKLVDARVPLLVVPGGSGNDFARSLGLNSRADAAAAWEDFCSGHGNVRDVDVGVITPLGSDSQTVPAHSSVTVSRPTSHASSSAAAGGMNRGAFSSRTAPTTATLFCCIGGAGLDAQTNRRVNHWPAWVRAHGGYILAALREIATWKPMPMAVKMRRPSGRWEDRIAEPATLTVFANAPWYGDGMNMAPQAQLDDGLLDICFVRGTSKRRIFTFFPTVFAGAHLSLPEVEYFQLAALRLETERPLDVYADGEYVCKTPVEVKVLPRALSVIVRRSAD
jgi:diacylglycerol kinase (ATP)